LAIIAKKEQRKKKIFIPSGVSGQICPYNKWARYEIDVRQYSSLKDSGTAVLIGDCRICYIDDELKPPE
jgi:hypothetical protein